MGGPRNEAANLGALRAIVNASLNRNGHVTENPQERVQPNKPLPTACQYLAQPS